MSKTIKRRDFLKTSGSLTGLAFLGGVLPSPLSLKGFWNQQVPVSGHLWVYASKYPPNWDCTPILEQVFSDFQYAGLEGLEMMEVHLRHEDVVPRVSELIERYGVPVTGTSYNGDMWNREKQQQILEDVERVLDHLHQLGGSTLGITVGNAGHVKTTAELDAQAEVLTKIRQLCDQYEIQPNLHNHTFEVENNLHDLKGTLERIPDMPLGPDLNWLIRGGVDPVEFIQTYGRQMVYMHIRDQQANGKWTEAVGEGVTDFPAIVKALQQVGFEGRAAIELAFDTPPQHDVKESWKKSREYVSQVFGW